MKTKMYQKELNKKAEEIKKIFEEYSEKIKELEKEKDRLMQEFVKKIEEAKINEIRNDIK
jgi:predicted nuclease with TOPRIM domain